MRISIYACITLFTFLFSCSSESQKKGETKEPEIKKKELTNQNLNLSIFLDVSDRISPDVHPNGTMEYYKRDLGYLNSVMTAFQNHILKKKIILMNDKVQVFIDPPPANSEINSIIDELRISINKNNVTNKMIETLNEKYSDACNKLYELAIHDNNFVGSDIWGFMKNKVNDYCISTEHRNILIIITDGYIYHKDNIINDGNRGSYLTTKKIRQLGLNTSNWEVVLKDKDCGFIVKNSDLDNLEVLVLGINAYKNSPFEEDVIRTYWENWLTGMGVKKFSIKSADLPTNLDVTIQNFILEP
jgi:hypothetical protein